MTILGGVAIALQTFGLIVTAVGLRFTWQEFHEPGERFRDPFVRALKRLDPRRRHERIVQVGLAGAVVMRAEFEAKHTFGPLPDDHGEAIVRLGEQVQGLRSNLESTATDIRRDVGQVTRRVDGLEGHVVSEADRLDRADRHVATDGLRLESFGLVIIAAGTLAQLVDGLIR